MGYIDQPTIYYHFSPSSLRRASDPDSRPLDEEGVSKGLRAPCCTGGVEVVAIKSIAAQKMAISSSLFHSVSRMARSAASQPLKLVGPLDARPPTAEAPLLGLSVVSSLTRSCSELPGGIRGLSSRKEHERISCCDS